MTTRLITILVATAALALALAAAAPAMHVHEGAFNIPWGTHRADIPGLHEVDSSGVVDFYEIPELKLFMPGINAERSVFGFIDERLYAVYFIPATGKDFSAAMDLFMDAFGNPRIRMEGDSKVYVWEDGNTKAKLKRGTTDGSRRIALYYPALLPENRRDETERRSDEAVRFLPVEQGDKPRALPLMRF